MRRIVAALVAVVLCASCASSPTSATATPIATAPEATAAPPPAGLAAPVAATASMRRRWFTLPDLSIHDTVNVAVAGVLARFDSDVSAGTPVARVRPGGREVPFVGSTGPDVLAASIELRGLTPGTYSVDVVEHLRSGAEAVAATVEFVLSAPLYVVWTLDFEGDAASDAALANTAAIADALHVPMTIMWNPRVWTTGQVPPARAEAMLAWTKARGATGDEVGLHIHAWTDFVRAAGLVPRTAPSWAGRSDGYDVPLTAFSEDETRTLVDHAIQLMRDHGLAAPTSFRGGGLFADAANLRAIAAAGFTVDTSATPAGSFGRLPLPWTLPKDAQPYRPSRDDANVMGDLPLLEVPNIAGNTYALTVTTIQPTIRADLAMLPPPGQPATARRVLTLVSHPATIDATERAAIDALFAALTPFRYEDDAGPLRFVTLAQVAQAYRP